jgi:hypothetical protein
VQGRRLGRQTRRIDAYSRKAKGYCPLRNPYLLGVPSNIVIVLSVRGLLIKMVHEKAKDGLNNLLYDNIPEHFPS